MSANSLEELREREHGQKLEVDRLRDELLRRDDLDGAGGLLAQLREAELGLGETGKLRVEAQTEKLLAEEGAKSVDRGGLIINTKTDTGLLSAATTGIDARIDLRMAQVPTSIIHLLDSELSPLVTCHVRNARELGGKTLRLRFTSFIEGYSSRAVDTVELRPHSQPQTLDQLPTLFPERIHGLNELTRATLNVMVEDLDTQKVELHKTKPIWLLPKTTATLAVKDLKSELWHDLTPYLGAFVTPNAPEVQEFQQEVRRHIEGEALKGYQGSADDVEPQVKAVFDALKSKGYSYTNSVIAFSPDEGATTQRVRLPRESLGGRQGNCIDGTVLFASLLESISLNPAIVIIPRHAFVGWETWKGSDGKGSNVWKFVDTTRLSGTFESACRWAKGWADFYKPLPYNTIYKELPDSTGSTSLLRLWSLRHLRTKRQITPME